MNWLVIVTVFFSFNSTWSFAKSLNLGSIGEDPIEEIQIFLPFANYLAKNVKIAGITSGNVVVAKDVFEMARLLRSGEVDIFIDSSFSALAVSTMTKTKFLLRRFKKGIGLYHGVVFSKIGSGISSLKDLRGKVVAFEEPFSTSGYLLPKASLVQHGLSLKQTQAPPRNPGTKHAGYIFSGGEQNTMLWVLKGRVAAGAMSNVTYSKIAKTGVGNLKNLKIIHQTFTTPSHLVVSRSDLSLPLVEKIKEVLLNMGKTDEGTKVLNKFEKTTKFDAISNNSLKQLFKNTNFIKKELGIK